MKVKFTAQVWEWYGNDEFTEGRYKAKGGADFVAEVDEIDFIYNEQEMIAKFLKAVNTSKYFKYDYLDHDEYSEPQMIELDKAESDPLPELSAEDAAELFEIPVEEFASALSQH